LNEDIEKERKRKKGSDVLMFSRRKEKKGKM